MKHEKNTECWSFQMADMGVSENGGTPKSSIWIGFSIIFTIHFGGISPYFWFNIQKLCRAMPSSRFIERGLFIQAA